MENHDGTVFNAQPPERMLEFVAVGESAVK